MNCQPGDLARIYGLPPSLADANDRIVKLTDEPPVVWNGDACWALVDAVNLVIASDCTNKFSREHFVAGDRAVIDVLADKYLRPIRGLPGTDEMVLKAGLPKANDLAPKRQVEFAR